MINKNIIVKALDEAISKCGVSAKKIKEAITPTIKKITDNPEIEEVLLTEISNFYKENYNKPKESFLAIYNNGERHEVKGSDKKVIISTELVNKGKEEGILMDIHNHPSGSCCPSVGDVVSFGKMNVRYPVVVSRNGVFIMDIRPDDSPFARFFPSIRVDLEDWQKTRIKEDYKQEFNSLNLDYLSGEITAEEAESSAKKLAIDWVNDMNNMKDSVDFFNKELEEESYEITCYYIPI